MIAIVFIVQCLYPCECHNPYYTFPPATHRYEDSFYKRYPNLSVPDCERKAWTR